MNKLKVGVLGAGHLGTIHLKILKELEEYNLIGFYDPDKVKSNKVEKELNVKSFDSIDDLLRQVDVLDIVTPTLSHFDCAVKGIKNSKHLFLEKPITNTVDQANELIELCDEANVKVQVGHVERFNPAFIEAQKHLNNPMFVETHRLSIFNPRGTDVSVVLDLMIHDIDIVLSIIKSPVKKISASGVAVISDTPDIANARLEFANGATANLTASRISLKNMRKSRFFQKDAYITVDFLEKKSTIVKMEKIKNTKEPYAMVIDLGKKGKRQIIFEEKELKNNKNYNAIKEELKSFAYAIQNDIPPKVSIYDGYNALTIAHQILEKINFKSDIIF